MHNLRLRKMLRDLWTDLARTMLVILSISVGVFALSLSFRTQAMFSNTLLTNFAAVSPADITLTVDPFDQQLVASLRSMPQLRAVEGYAQLDMRIRVGNQWRSMIVLAIDDIPRMQVNQLAPAGGAWPPPDHTLLIERSYLQSLGATVGAPVLLETPSGRQVQIPVSGLTYDATAVSARLGSPIAFGYVSLATAEWLGSTSTMNTLQLVVASDRFDQTHVNDVVRAVQHKVELAGYHVQNSATHMPDTPELYNSIAAMLAILRALGFLSLLLSAFLIINTVNGLLVRQTPQIGVLKAIGATRRDVALMYLGGVAVLALLALLVAVPLAVVASRWLTQLLAYQFNYDVHDFGVPPSVIALEWGAGLIAPLLAALPAILSGTRVTVRQAIAGPSSDQFGASALDRLFGRMQGGPVAQRYVLRNMLRRKSRLALTLAVLGFGGAITMAVLSVRTTLLATLDGVSMYWQQDVTVLFTDPQRTDQIMQTALRVPGVASVESQPARLGVRRRPDGRDADEPTALFGVHPDSSLLQPTIVQGRWLTPQDTQAAVVNVGFLKREPDVKVGSTITMRVDDRTSTWLVVGVATIPLFNYRSSVPNQAVLYANFRPFTLAINDVGATNRLLVVTTQHDPAFQARVAQALEAAYDLTHEQPMVQTRATLYQRATSLISGIVLLLLVMVCVFIAVAGLSLSGAMSLNVLDRTKEIGVLRAIGSSSAQVVWLVLLEGVYNGVLSWLLAVVIALPLGKIMSDTLGWDLLDWPLHYIFPPSAALIWLLIVIVLASSASYLPAAKAARVSVRDVLVYE